MRGSLSRELSAVKGVPLKLLAVFAAPPTNPWQDPKSLACEVAYQPGKPMFCCTE